MVVDETPSPIQRAIGILLALLVSTSLPVSLTLRSFSAHLFAPEWFESALVRNLADTGALRPLVMREMVAEAGGLQGLEPLTADMSEDEVDQLHRLLIPDQWWEDQFRSGVDAFYRWIDSEATAPQFVLDLQPIRERLRGEAGEEAVDLVMASWPECTLGQLRMLAAEILGGGEPTEFRCRPPDPYRSLLRGALLEALRGAARTMPATATVAPIDDSQGDAAEFARLKRNLRLARWLGSWGWMVPVALLGLIMAVNVRSLKTWGLWWGPPLMAAGVLSAFFAFIVAGPVETRSVAALAAIDAPTVVRSALAGVTRDLFRQSLGGLLFWAIATGGIGFALTLTGVFAPNPEG